MVFDLEGLLITKKLEDLLKRKNSLNREDDFIPKIKRQSRGSACFTGLQK